MILVTGGLGYIGSHTVVELINAGFKVVIIDDLSNSEISVLEGIETLVAQKVPFHQVDIKNLETLKETLKAYSFTGCIHFAASKAVGESQQIPLEYYENNILGLLNVLKLQIPNIIFSSSCTVYGQADELPITENAPIKPAESVYGKTKQMGEVIVQDYVELLKNKAIILRYFNPIGAHPSALIGELPIGIPNNLIPYVTQTAAGIRESLAIFGNDYPTEDGTCIRDYIYVVDLAKAHVKALQRLINKENTSELEFYNLGTGNGNSVLEVVKTFEEVNHLELKYHFAPKREGDIISAYANAEKAEKELGWKAETTLAEALQTCWNWQKSRA